MIYTVTLGNIDLFAKCRRWRLQGRQWKLFWSRIIKKNTFAWGESLRTFCRFDTTPMRDRLRHMRGPWLLQRSA